MRKIYWRNSIIRQSLLARFLLWAAMRIDNVEWFWNENEEDCYIKRGIK